VSPREKKPAADQLDGTREIRVRTAPVRRPVAARAQRIDLGRGEAEQEKVLGAHFVAQLDIRAVERADRQRAIHRELHVAGTGRLLARRRDLLR